MPEPSDCGYGMSLDRALAPYLTPKSILRVRAELAARITPEMESRQEAARARVRARNARVIGPREREPGVSE